jgi:hypothetical protein
LAAVFIDVNVLGPDLKEPAEALQKKRSRDPQD